MYVFSMIRTSYTVYVSVRNVQKNFITYICSMAKLKQVYVRLQCGPYIFYSVREREKHTGKRHLAHMYVPSVVHTYDTAYVSARNIQENAFSCTCSMAKLIGTL